MTKIEICGIINNVVTDFNIDIKSFYEETTADIYTFSDGHFLVSDIAERKNYDVYLLDADMQDILSIEDFSKSVCR